jgi:hypothetical protein
MDLGLTSVRLRSGYVKFVIPAKAGIQVCMADKRPWHPGASKILSGCAPVEKMCHYGNVSNHVFPPHSGHGSNKLPRRVQRGSNEVK